MESTTEIPSIGTVSGTASIALTDAVVDEFLAGMEMDDPIFQRDGLELGKRLAPSHLAPKIALYPLYGDFIEKHFNGAIFAKQMYVFHAPAWAGTTVVAEARLVEIYERRGKTFAVFEGRFSREDGELLVVERRTVMPINQNAKPE